MRDLCKDAGCRVFRVEDGQATLYWLDSGPTPALILLDLVRLALNGCEVARRNHPLPRFRAVAIVVVSGVFSKPFDPDRLLAAIRDHVPPEEPS